MALVRAKLGESGVSECSYIDAHANKVETPTAYFGLRVELGKEGTLLFLQWSELLQEFQMFILFPS